MLETLWDLVRAAARSIQDHATSIDVNELLFLPPGKGPAILILGGITMLAASLFLALHAPRARPASASPRQARGPSARARGSTQERSREAPPAPELTRPTEVQALIDICRQRELGQPRVASTDLANHRVAFHPCPGERQRDPIGCQRLATMLGRVLRSRGINAEVACLACNAGTGRACLFEIQPGALHL